VLHTVQSLEREQPKNSSQALGLVLETEGAEGIMGFLVLLIVAIGTTTLAVRLLSDADAVDRGDLAPGEHAPIAPVAV
jgi:hypothetical protein